MHLLQFIGCQEAALLTHFENLQETFAASKV